MKNLYTKLLTIGNPKTQKGIKRGFITAVLHLAPYIASGRQTCPMAELASCWQGCLNTAGRGGMSKGNSTTEFNGITLPDNAIQRCRIRRTNMLFDEPRKFWELLISDICRCIEYASAHDLKPCIRLNGTSDLRWETMRFEGRTIFEWFPSVQFYDYSKIPNRRGLPENYHLTLSYSAANPQYELAIMTAADSVTAPKNLAVVFRKALPPTFLGWEVIDGDESDLRFLDPVGVVVGLKAKGKAKKDTSGFVVDARENVVISKIGSLWGKDVGPVQGYVDIEYYFESIADNSRDGFTVDRITVDHGETIRKAVLNAVKNRVSAPHIEKVYIDA